VLFDESAGIYKIWCTQYKDGGSRTVYGESPDGLSWMLRPEPVLLPSNEWEGMRLFYPCVLKRQDGGYDCWYTGISKQNAWSVGHATSNDGLIWTKDAAPVLPAPLSSRPIRFLAEAFTKLTGQCIRLPVYGKASPCVWHEGEGYRMLTHEIGTRGLLFIVQYDSNDGRSWKMVSRDVWADKPRTAWDAFFQADPFVLCL